MKESTTIIWLIGVIGWVITMILPIFKYGFKEKALISINTERM